MRESKTLQRKAHEIVQMQLIQSSLVQLRLCCYWIITKYGSSDKRRMKILRILNYILHDSFYARILLKFSNPVQFDRILRTGLAKLHIVQQGAMYEYDGIFPSFVIFFFLEKN